MTIKKIEKAIASPMSRLLYTTRSIYLTLVMAAVAVVVLFVALIVLAHKAA